MRKTIEKDTLEKDTLKMVKGLPQKEQDKLLLTGHWLCETSNLVQVSDKRMVIDFVDNNFYLSAIGLIGAIKCALPSSWDVKEQISY